MSRWFIQRVGLCLALVCAAPRVADACECPANPPCAAYWKADAVFVGTVTDIAAEPLGASVNWSVTRFVVSQAFRGDIGRTITIVPGERPSAEWIRSAAATAARQVTYPASSCSYTFKVGQRYVVYAKRTAAGDWTTSECSGNKLLAEASKDLDYLAAASSAPAIGQVFGRIERTIVDPSDPTRTVRVPEAGIDVSIVSRGLQLTARTDEDGVLDAAVPGGQYTITPIVPPTVRARPMPMHVTVPMRGCAPAYFWLIANGRVEGRVVRSDGAPVSGVALDVFPVELTEDKRPYDSARVVSKQTDWAGQFDMDGILPGRYRLLVNARFGPKLSAPYLSSWNDAPIIGVAEGERKRGLVVVADPLPEVTVSGVALVDAAAANDGVTVTAVPYAFRGAQMDSTKPDADGAFRLRVLAGENYIIRASWRTAGGVRTAEETFYIDKPIENIRLVIRP